MEVTLLETAQPRPAPPPPTIRQTDTIVAHHATEGAGRLLARFSGRRVEIGYIGGEYLIEFVDDAGRVYQDQGDRPSTAWDEIEAQMRAEAVAQ